jgi:cell division protein FtsX
LALGLLHVSLYYLQSPLDQLLDAYGNSFALVSLTIQQVFLVLVAGGALGFLGAWVSVERYLWILRRGGLAGRI